MLLSGVSADVTELGVLLLTSLVSPQNPSLVQSWRKAGQRRNIILDILSTCRETGGSPQSVSISSGNAGANETTSDAKVFVVSYGSHISEPISIQLLDAIRQPTALAQTVFEIPNKSSVALAADKQRRSTGSVAQAADSSIPSAQSTSQASAGVSASSGPPPADSSTSASQPTSNRFIRISDLMLCVVSHVYLIYTSVEPHPIARLQPDSSKTSLSVHVNGQCSSSIKWLLCMPVTLSR